MKSTIKIPGSSWIMLLCLIILIISMAVATFVENDYGTGVARKYIYEAKWFELILIIGSFNLILSIFSRKLYKLDKFGVFVFHIAFVFIILGAGITRYFGMEGSMSIREGESSSEIILGDNTRQELQFSLFLEKFIIDYYPGSTNPSGYESRVKLVDKEKGISEQRRIFMNNILKHRGYRFYQSSYHQDGKGTILSVSSDPVGTFITYFGYFLLAIGMVFSFLNKGSRINGLIRGSKPVMLMLFIYTFGNSLVFSQDSIKIIPKEHADKFGKILIRDPQGRTMPVYTLTSEIFRKVYRKNNYQGQNSMQVMLGIIVQPEKWQNIKMVYAGTQVAKELELGDKYTNLLNSYLQQGRFISTQPAALAYRKSPSARTKTDNYIIRFDERLNILYHWYMLDMLNIFPNNELEGEKWLNPYNAKGMYSSEDSIFTENIISLYVAESRNSLESGNWSKPDEIVDAIMKYQQKRGEHLPSSTKVNLELWYYKSDVFKNTSYLYLVFGLLLLILQFILIFKEKDRFKLFKIILLGGLGGSFILHTYGLAVRWFISGHAPWTNTYETMVFISWSAMMAGLLFIRKNQTATAIASVKASIFLVVANMTWMDPQITNLVPVLNSVWLVIHVAVITLSYGFLGIGALMAVSNLLIIILRSKKNYERTSSSINELTNVIEITLTIGLFLITIGTFLGAIWANVSWGRYWAWDPKETWALITVIVYAVVLHLRLIPVLKSQILFNILAVWAYLSVLMTYFGVNFYLTGLHSYAQGEPAPIPIWVFSALIALILLTGAAFLKDAKFKSADKRMQMN